ncbi:hypothetical protein CHELA20_11244 [Hyphomicrobiales bacterium]|nr:hypothetical protein CHELA20_11244 [Hyphomicrobiales bacterium]CAH1695419.1 hypothetical protein CHELA41_51492 [Hyphomicrobiales bacterium]
MVRFQRTVPDNLGWKLTPPSFKIPLVGTDTGHLLGTSRAAVGIVANTIRRGESGAAGA